MHINSQSDIYLSIYIYIYKVDKFYLQLLQQIYHNMDVFLINCLKRKLIINNFVNKYSYNEKEFLNSKFYNLYSLFLFL